MPSAGAMGIAFVCLAPFFVLALLNLNRLMSVASTTRASSSAKILSQTVTRSLDEWQVRVVAEFVVLTV